MQKLSQFYVISLLFTFFFILLAVNVNAANQVGNVTVSAAVLGEKPLVSLITPVTGTNTGSIALTKIVGRNFGSTASYITGVSLDDPGSTVLSGTVTLATGCDSNGDGCGGGGSYQKITGLSVPANVTPGVYNVLVTTPLGTNLLSDTKFTVAGPVATATPSISNIQPSYISVMANLADVVNISFTIKDSDTAAVEFDTDNNISIGTVTTGNYAPANRTTTAANAADGEQVSFDFNSNSAPEAYGTLDIRVGDGGDVTTGNTSFEVVDIFIEPSW